MAKLWRIIIFALLALTLPVSARADDSQGPARNRQLLGAHFLADGDALDRGGEAETDMDDIVARRHGQDRLGQARVEDQRILPVRR